MEIRGERRGWGDVGEKRRKEGGQGEEIVWYPLEDLGREWDEAIEEYWGVCKEAIKERERERRLEAMGEGLMGVGKGKGKARMKD